MSPRDQAVVALHRLAATRAFGEAIDSVESAAGTKEDRAVALWVASALHGIATGLDETGAGDEAVARLRVAGARMVRDLASGEWRRDVDEERRQHGAGA